MPRYAHGVSPGIDHGLVDTLSSRDGVVLEPVLGRLIVKTDRVESSVLARSAASRPSTSGIIVKVSRIVRNRTRGRPSGSSDSGAGSPFGESRRAARCVRPSKRRARLEHTCPPRRRCGRPLPTASTPSRNVHSMIWSAGCGAAWTSSCGPTSARSLNLSATAVTQRGRRLTKPASVSTPLDSLLVARCFTDGYRRGRLRSLAPRLLPVPWVDADDGVAGKAATSLTLGCRRSRIRCRGTA